MNSVARHLALPLSAVMTPFALSDADELRAMFMSAGFKTATIVPEATTVRFPEPERFVPLAVASSAAAVPAFVQLSAPERASLLEAVRVDVEPTIRAYRQDDVISFPMFAHVAVAAG